MALISKHSTDFYQVTTATARHWHDLALSTASVAKNIVGATESLLKWALFRLSRAAPGYSASTASRIQSVASAWPLWAPEATMGRVRPS
jgi:hypothetical protein